MCYPFDKLNIIIYNKNTYNLILFIDCLSTKIKQYDKNRSYVQKQAFSDCGYPSAPVNGTIKISIANHTSYGARAVYSCDEGFDPVDNRTISCQADGNWSDKPTCTITGQYTFFTLPHVSERVLWLSVGMSVHMYVRPSVYPKVSL